MEEVYSLCIDCGKSCTKGCSWARDFIPVDGWTAKETKKGYLVLACPEKVDDAPIRDIDKDGMLRLMEALALSINEDYVSGTPAMRRVIEKDLKEGPARNLLQLTDTDTVIRKLRTIAKRYDSCRERCVEP